MKKIIDLGFANGWHDTPDVIKEAKEKGFKVEEVERVTWYQIETDDSIIKWMVDSSD
jgi:hypothetical protein